MIIKIYTEAKGWDNEPILLTDDVESICVSDGKENAYVFKRKPVGYTLGVNVYLNNEKVHSFNDPDGDA